jgi:arginine utilization protein RocB
MRASVANEFGNAPARAIEFLEKLVLRRQGDCLFGRGTADMKGFLACMLVAAEYATARFPLLGSLSCTGRNGYSNSIRYN